MSIVDSFVKLSKQLYPTGRAFKMPFNGYLESLHKALAVSEAKFYTDARAILFGILPDNQNFTDDDATAWERRLGLITAEAVPLEDRKAAIARKMNFPDQKPRQNYMFLQNQLNKAGFDVTVYENRFSDGMGGYITRDPLDVSAGVGAAMFEYGTFEYGDSEFGVQYQNICVNHIDEKLDWTFNVGANLKSTFFIGGTTLGSFAQIPLARKNEFRQLILKCKPTQTVGFLLINYV